MLERLTLAFDGDGVIFDWDAVFIPVLRVLGFEPLPSGWQRIPKEADALIDEYVRSHPGIVRDLPLMEPGIQEHLSALRDQGHEVIAVTAHAVDVPSWVPERTAALQALGFRKDEIVFTHGKAYADADVLVDDKPKHVSNFVNRRRYCHGVFYHHDRTSKSRPEEPRVRVVRNWEELMSTIEVLGDLCAFRRLAGIR